MTWVVQPAWVGALYIPQVPGICPASGEQDRLWQHKVKSVGKTRLKWKGGKRSCVFLEFPEAPDTGSLFPLFSWATARSGGSCTSPSWRAALRRALPHSTVSLWKKGNLCLHTEQVPWWSPSSSIYTHGPLSMRGILAPSTALLPAAFAYRHVSRPHPCPRALAFLAPDSAQSACFLLMFSTPKTAYSFSPQPSPGPPGNAFPAIALRSSRPFLCGPQACLHLVDSALDFSHLWGWSSTTWWVLQVEGPCSRTDPAN